MAREQNFLLGRGERLTHPIKIGRQSRAKSAPYDFIAAKERLITRSLKVLDEIAELPNDALPRNEVVATITMHPRFVAKSERPTALLASLGLRAVGSKSRVIVPAQWGTTNHDEEGVAEDLFVAGAVSSFRQWHKRLEGWTERDYGTDDLLHIEDLFLPSPATKVRGEAAEAGALLEVVLHNGGYDDVARGFAEFVQARGGEVLLDRRRDVDGLTFVPARTGRARPADIAAFSFVRLARGMPTLRPLPVSILRSIPASPLVLPDTPAIHDGIRAAIFDGGIPTAALKSLRRWVTLVEPRDVDYPHPDYEAHGLAVTSAFLFGHLADAQSLRTPACPVDHVRILDVHTGQVGDPEYFDVLKRITTHLDANVGRYALVNISLGPQMAVDDDDVTLWTSELDRRFADGKCVVTVAAGNDGDRRVENRVQPPSDAVNVLAVGAADTCGEEWNRATYSCVGPGRSPGLMKPDGLGFGGSSTEAFGVLDANLRITQTMGTSFAAPAVLRSAAMIAAQIGSDVHSLGTRAVLVHRAQRRKSQNWRDVGWGRFEDDSSMLLTCSDDEALVVYQGDLPVSEHLRAPVPLANVALAGRVTISATLVIAADVDPEYPATYTRCGLEVVFRPHAQRFKLSPNGVKSDHPQTFTFFSRAKMYGTRGLPLRSKAHQWETCVSHSQSFPAGDLDNPLFDIYYHHRKAGLPLIGARPIPYALVVSVKAPAVTDLYDQIVRAYASILQPLRLRNQVQLRAG